MNSKRIAFDVAVVHRLRQSGTERGGTEEVTEENKSALVPVWIVGVVVVVVRKQELRAGGGDMCRSERKRLDSEASSVRPIGC